MAATIRRLGFSSAWLLVSFISILPVLGIVAGLWPQESIAFRDIEAFWGYKSLSVSVAMTLFSAVFSTLISFYIAFMVFSQYHLSTRLQSFEKFLAPVLALPHLAIALGLVFLFSDGSLFFVDSGLPRKGLSTLITAIVVKEVPFFLLILSAIGRQLPIRLWLLQGRALGYQEHIGWWLLVFPAVLKQSRLALLAASAYTLSVVDVSFLVGPNIPELFAVAMYRWQTSFSPGDQSLAFLGNVMLITLLLVSIVMLYGHEKLLSAACKHCSELASGLRFGKVNRLFVVWLPLTAVVILLMVAVFLLFSLGANWQVDGNLLANLHSQLWQNEWLFFSLPLQNSTIIAVFSALLGVAAALLALELQRRKNHYLPDYFWLLGILLPQLSMVLGWQVFHIWLEGGYNKSWIVLSHLPFTFSYAYLVLKGPFQSIEPHYELLAASFGYSKWQSWFKVRFRLLLPAVLIALAISFSVSIAQYIPTLMIGAGRVTTITTEAVAIGTGNQQDVLAVYILLQSCLPFVAFLVAALLAQKFRGSIDVKTH